MILNIEWASSSIHSIICRPVIHILSSIHLPVGMKYIGFTARAKHSNDTNARCDAQGTTMLTIGAGNNYLSLAYRPPLIDFDSYGGQPG